MRILVIGGNRFLGVELTARLLARGDDVTLLNRGTLSDPFGPRVKRLIADRGTDAFDRALAGTTWEAIVDLALFDRAQTERLLRVVEGRVGHLIVISTGQVYLVRTPRPGIATEADFDGPVLEGPPSPGEIEEWRYGVEKRDVETTLAASALPYTTLRLPMVHGGREQKRRLDRVLWKLMDGAPIVLTQPEAPLRHVFSGAVVRTIVSLLDGDAKRRAYNLAWSEPLTARGFVEEISRAFGATPHFELRDHEAVPSLFVNSRWMSALDASLAQRELGFVHEPLGVWLPQVLHALVSRWTEPPR